MTGLSKERILRDIRRCAETNGGVPLGKARFEMSTGIREADWSGRYWARWSEAVSEAGFRPNMFQGRVLDDAGLVRCLASLAQRLGHFPTAPEMRMQRRTDSTFPNDKVFTTRLGSRADQRALVADFALAHTDFADVYDMVVEPGGRAPSASLAAPGAVIGSVYLMRSGNHFKIGRSNHVGRRAYEVALQLPERLDLVHELETDDPPGIERYWHLRFADRRTNGEWFALTSEDVAAFKRRKRFM